MCFKFRAPRTNIKSQKNNNFKRLQREFTLIKHEIPIKCQ